MQRKGRGCSGRHHELRPRYPSGTEETSSATSAEAAVRPRSSQQLSNTSLHFHSIVPQLDSFDTIIGSDWVTQHNSFQDEDLHHRELLPLSVVATSFNSSIDYINVRNSLAFDSTFSQTPFVSLDEHGNSTSGTSLSTLESFNVPREDEISAVIFDALNSEMILSYPTPSNDTPEPELVGSSPMTLSILRSNSRQHSGFYWLNSFSPSKSPISDRSRNKDLSTNEFVNQGFGLETVSSGDLDFLFGGPAHTTSMYMATPPSLPDPFMNYLQLSKVSPFTAYSQIAICLGITLQDLTSAKYSSPFYRATTAADDPKALLAKAAIPSLPAHLQPTLPQILFPHNAYIDLLPFPILRARAISLAMTTPPLINSRELKMDILRDGLICWDTGNGNRYGESCDISSWEASPWFLKKWRMLLDGEDGEIWNQSVWWQRLRNCPR